jgi:hypothetical protein
VAGGNPNMVKGLPSVNPTGRGGKWKPLSDALRMELAAEPQRARRIARRLLQEAEEGNLQAAQILFDRTEGKALQMLEVGAAGEFMDNAERTNRILELQRKTMIEDAVEVPLLPTRVNK